MSNFVFLLSGLRGLKPDRKFGVYYKTQLNKADACGKKNSSQKNLLNLTRISDRSELSLQCGWVQSVHCCLIQCAKLLLKERWRFSALTNGLSPNPECWLTLSSTALLEKRSCHQRLSSSHLSYMSRGALRPHCLALGQLLHKHCFCRHQINIHVLLKSPRRTLVRKIEFNGAFFTDEKVSAGEPLLSVLKHFSQYDTTFKSVLNVKTWTWRCQKFSLSLLSWSELHWWPTDLLTKLRRSGYLSPKTCRLGYITWAGVRCADVWWLHSDSRNAWMPERPLFSVQSSTFVFQPVCQRNSRIRANRANQERLVKISRVLLYTDNYIQSVE